MNKKISLGLSLAVTFIAVAITVAITMSVSMRTYNSLIKDLPNRSQMYSYMSELDNIVRTNYYGTINENLLNSEISDGYASGLGDRYSRYMTASEFRTYQNELNGEKVGIGIIAFYDEAETAIFVAEVSENSPAAQSGISKGDKIIEIDEERVTAYNYSALMSKLEGDKLTSVTIRFVHDGVEQSVGVVKGYSAQSVYYSLDQSVGYIKITDFYSTTESQLRQAVEALSKQGATSLIFDVRNTSSGTIEYAAEVIDYLVPVASEGSGAIATAKNKDGEVIETFTSDADSVSMNMTVLVNKNTSGPAELFACDLRDFGKAQIVGVTTSGNGTMQKTYQLSDGSAIVLTVAEITPYTSPTYNYVGVVPDHEVALTDEQNIRLSLLSKEEDAQYIKAYNILIGKE